MISLNRGEISQRIKEGRKSTDLSQDKLSQEELAKKVDVDRRTIQRFENCVPDSVLTFAKVISELNLSADYVLFGTKDNNDYTEIVQEIQNVIDKYR